MVYKRSSIIPGFGITLGFTLLYLGLIVLIPMSALAVKAAGAGWPELLKAAAEPRVLSAFRLSFGVSFAAAVVDTCFGLVVAWVLVRYSFPGRKLMNAMVDLPFALPTAVAGIALTTIYSQNGLLGHLFWADGIKIAFTPFGIGIALIFVGIPFVVRTVEPVLLDMDREEEEAAQCLGATRWQTFIYITLPQIAPALLTGFAMSFARGLGEYGSVIFIAGNMPYKSEIVPLLIVIKLEQYDYAGAAAIAMIMLIAAFAILLAINALQRWNRSRRTCL